MEKHQIPKCAVINDLAGVGRSSLVAAISILASMGVQPCPVPTAILSSQTSGIEDYTFWDFTPRMTEYISHWKRLGLYFDSIYTGYLGSAVQVDIVLDFISHFKGENSLLLVDPVLGDHGELYDGFSELHIAKMKDLVKKADVITPNFTEFCFLTGLPFSEIPKSQEIERYLLEVGVECIVITSFPGVCSRTLVFQRSRPAGNHLQIIEKELFADSYPGTGDLFASLLTGALTKGRSLAESTEQAIDFLQRALSFSQNIPEKNIYGVSYERVLSEFLFL